MIRPEIMPILMNATQFTRFDQKKTQFTRLPQQHRKRDRQRLPYLWSCWKRDNPDSTHGEQFSFDPGIIDP